MGRGGTMGGGKPPLCRAVHLALGVAVLGSLMGGVQLFGMIKMLGLQKADMSSQQNEWAWYGYQVRSKNLLKISVMIFPIKAYISFISATLSFPELRTS